MTVADFSEVILNLNNQGNNALTVEDAERIFDAYDTNDDSALELEEFIPAFREIYLRVYNNQRRIRESSF
jgi:Ca2+-binding EF-hand superfamily protein